MGKKEKIQFQIELAIQTIDAFLKHFNEKEHDFTTVHELMKMKANLTEMSESLKKGFKIEPSGMGRHIVDVWPLGTDLGTKIIEAEIAYENFKF